MIFGRSSYICWSAISVICYVSSALLTELPKSLRSWKFKIIQKSRVFFDVACFLKTSLSLPLHHIIRKRKCEQNLDIVYVVVFLGSSMTSPNRTSLRRFPDTIFFTSSILSSVVRHWHLPGFIVLACKTYTYFNGEIGRNLFDPFLSTSDNIELTIYIYIFLSLISQWVETVNKWS